MDKKIIGVLAGLGLVCAQLPAWAQETQKNYQLNEVVVTASKSPRKQSEIGKVVRVISAQQLEQNQGRSLTELLNQVAGLTIGGKIPFTGTFANFSTGRVYDQIRQCIAYSGKNVKICASHAGITLGEDGATHHGVLDIAYMKCIQGMVVTAPKDGNELQFKNCGDGLYTFVNPNENINFESNNKEQLNERFNIQTSSASSESIVRGEIML